MAAKVLVLKRLRHCWMRLQFMRSRWELYLVWTLSLAKKLRPFYPRCASRMALVENCCAVIPTTSIVLIRPLRATDKKHLKKRGAYASIAQQSPGRAPPQIELFERS